MSNVKKITLPKVQYKEINTLINSHTHEKLCRKQDYDSMWCFILLRYWYHCLVKKNYLLKYFTVKKALKINGLSIDLHSFDWFCIHFTMIFVSQCVFQILLCITKYKAFLFLYFNQNIFITFRIFSAEID